MNGAQVGFAAGFAVLIVIGLIAMRGAKRRTVTSDSTLTSASSDDTGAAMIFVATMADSSISDCGSSDGGGGCD